MQRREYKYLVVAYLYSGNHPHWNVAVFDSATKAKGWSCKQQRRYDLVRQMYLNSQNQKRLHRAARHVSLFDHRINKAFFEAQFRVRYDVQPVLYKEIGIID